MMNYDQKVNTTGDYAECNVLARTMYLLRMFVGWNAQALEIMRLTLTTCLKKITNRARLFTNNYDFSLPCWENIFSLLWVMEEFIFYRPVTNDAPSKEETIVYEDTVGAGLHLSKGTILDLPLVDLVLELLTALHLKDDFGQATAVGASPEETSFKARGSNEWNFYKEIKQTFENIELCLKNGEKTMPIMKSLSQLLTNRNRAGVGWLYRRKKTVIWIDAKAKLRRDGEKGSVSMMRKGGLQAASSSNLFAGSGGVMLRGDSRDGATGPSIMVTGPAVPGARPPSSPRQRDSGGAPPPTVATGVSIPPPATSTTH